MSIHGGKSLKRGISRALPVIWAALIIWIFATFFVDSYWIFHGKQEGRLDYAVLAILGSAVLLNALISGVKNAFDFFDAVIRIDVNGKEEGIKADSTARLIALVFFCAVTFVGPYVSLRYYSREQGSAQAQGEIRDTLKELTSRRGLTDKRGAEPYDYILMRRAQNQLVRMADYYDQNESLRPEQEQLIDMLCDLLAEAEDHCISLKLDQGSPCPDIKDLHRLYLDIGGARHGWARRHCSLLGKAAGRTGGR